MKTIDEAIEALEDARVQVETGTGYWVDYRDNDDLKADALHYLKAFRDAKDALEREKDRYAEAVKNCERAENIYKQKQKAAEDALWICKEDKDDLTALRAYWAEQQANPALTWDELRTMEGKPVWVEGTRGNMWIIVGAFPKWMPDAFADSVPNIWWKKEDLGTDWQAYRKER